MSKNNDNGKEITIICCIWIWFDPLQTTATATFNPFCWWEVSTWRPLPTTRPAPNHPCNHSTQVDVKMFWQVFNALLQTHTKNTGNNKCSFHDVVVADNVFFCFVVSKYFTRAFTSPRHDDDDDDDSIHETFSLDLCFYFFFLLVAPLKCYTALPPSLLRCSSTDTALAFFPSTRLFKMTYEVHDTCYVCYGPPLIASLSLSLYDNSYAWLHI